MGDETTARLIVKYTNGNTQTFEFTRQGNELTSGGLISKAVEGNMLILELEDKVLFIPFQNIESIEVSPPPAKLPETAVRGARFVE